ncbi:MAG: hypothetical protein DRJ61_18090, partial [Acidobacteria bacterium]
SARCFGVGTKKRIDEEPVHLVWIAHDLVVPMLRRNAGGSQLKAIQGAFPSEWKTLVSFPRALLSCSASTIFVR